MRARHWPGAPAPGARRASATTATRLPGHRPSPRAAGMGLGMASGALDNFVEVGTTKIPGGKKSPLRDNAGVQTDLALAEVGIRSARAFLLHSMADIWKQISAGDKLTVDHRITIRMGSTNAIHRARGAVDFAYNAAGATATFQNPPLQRPLPHIP